MTQQIKHLKTNRRKNYINRKYWNKRTRGTAIPEDQQIFKKVAPEPYIEGSETDSIERGLQNQYQRWGYNPDMLYG